MNRLDKYIKQVRGISYSPNDISEIPLDNYLPILKANNIQENRLDTSSLIYIHESKIKKEQLIKRGDLLLAASSGSKDIVGKNVFFESDFKGSFGAFCKVVRPNQNIYPKFLGVFFKTPVYKRHIRNLIQGANINNLRNEDIDSLKIPDFSKEDQLHIANILTKAENLVFQRKESIHLLDEYLKSTFLEMFGDPMRNEKGWSKLDGQNYCQKITVGVVIKPASHYVEKGVIAIRSLNVKPNKFDLTNLVYFSKKTNETELSKSILREGDVVFVRTGVTGTAAIVPKELDGCNCIDLIITRPKIGIMDAIYLTYFFNSDIGKRIVTSKEVGGIQKHFNIGAIKALKIPVPPIELQNRFAQIVEKTDVLKTQYQQSLHELEDLYGSLSQKAFRGELTINKTISV
jgi:type I restriction enzyme S subunit